ncbi:MAG: DegV family protein [Thermomicrobiales bacterium]|nr:DegV family protein [Thermomicrobiales bacterium]MCO5217657.1 DegV family protein [Thermomicrobiales bacterium]MCO5226389.1 DegV family protein [Thermomicrobiales bacterium]MCO5228166.1 DegV family protein [Thermomicrobiales bacterium]
MTANRTVAIVTDSTCDLDKDLARSRSITVVPLNVHFGEEVFLDQVEISTDEFMEKMASTVALPTTSQPSVGAFERAYREAAEAEGVKDIVCVVLSSKLSGTFQSASIAAQNLAEELSVEVVDSFSVSYGLGFQALRAADLADEGKSATEIATTLQNEISRYHIVFFAETLEHLRRGGRIGKAAQLVGTLLQLKPLLRLDEGVIVPYERTRTRSKAIKALETFVNDIGSADEITVLYNTTPDDAQALADAVQPKTPNHTSVLAKVSPVIATHLGPGVLGVIVKEKMSE